MTPVGILLGHPAFGLVCGLAFWSLILRRQARTRTHALGHVAEVSGSR